MKREGRGCKIASPELLSIISGVIKHESRVDVKLNFEGMSWEKMGKLLLS